MTVDATSASRASCKSTNSTGYGAAGDTIDYSYLVTNTGTTHAPGVGVTDSLVGSRQLPELDPRPRGLGDLHRQLHGHPGRRGRRSVTNTATATRHVDPQSQSRSPRASSSVTVVAAYATSTLSMVKSTTRPGTARPGDTIPYSYLVTNTGTTTLTSVGVTDNLVGHGQLPGLDPGPRGVGDLHRHLHGDPGRRGRRLGDQHGHRHGHRSATRGGQLASSSVTVQASNATSTPDLTKSTTSTGYGAAGNMISYNYLVTNTGTTTLSSVQA